MDLEIETSVEKVAEILKAVGFERVIVNGKLIEAKTKDGWGRFHVVGIELESDITYLDVHRDSFIHMAFLGVDYGKKPRTICERITDCADQVGVRCRVIGGTSWFNRKNKAIFGGIRL